MKSYFFVGMLVVFGLGLSACSGASIPVVPTLSETAESVSEGAAGADESVPESAATPAPAQEQNSPAQNSPEALIASFDQAAQTAGELLILYGQLLDAAGTPIPDAVVEIWQTDSHGVYDHPNDPGTQGRETTFQFFGMASTDAAGAYAFRTIVPGRYEPRPRHIHFKVKQDGATLLTSQFYFSEDVAEVAGEGMFRAVGESGDLLLLQLVQGDGVLLANGQIVVDAGTGAASLPLTPAQGEGPYYPVVALDSYDNDLVVLP